MSDTFAGLTRRLNDFVHTQGTAEELSHLVAEAQEPGGDAADALIELALGEEHIADDDDVGLGDELEAIVEDDELVDVEEDEEVDESAADAELAALEAEDEDDQDDDLLENAALRSGEVLVI